MDPPYKSFKPFDLNHAMVHASHYGPTGQTLRHILKVCVPVHDTEILDIVKPLVINQLCVSNTFGDAAQLQNIMDFL